MAPVPPQGWSSSGGPQLGVRRRDANSVEHSGGSRSHAPWVSAQPTFVQAVALHVDKLINCAPSVGQFAGNGEIECFWGVGQFLGWTGLNNLPPFEESVPEYGDSVRIGRVALSTATLRLIGFRI